MDSLVAREAPQEGNGVWQPGTSTEKGLKYNCYQFAVGVIHDLLPQEVHARLMRARPPCRVGVRFQIRHGSDLDLRGQPGQNRVT